MWLLAITLLVLAEMRPVAAETHDVSLSAPLAVRTYLTACLFEHLGEQKEQPPWQLPYSDLRTSPYIRSDKCDTHAYHHAYSRYLVPLANRFTRGQLPVAKVLEIGLGCGQRNVGAGVRMWDSLFANSDGRRLILHVLEYRADCAAAWQARWADQFKHVNLTIFTGSQADPLTLGRIASVGGGSYDAIVDDGGHRMVQQQTSLRHLFHLLKPGAWYAIEDVQTSFMRGYVDSNTHTTIDLLGQMIRWLSGDRDSSNWAEARFRSVMTHVEHVDCYSEICVLQRYAEWVAQPDPEQADNLITPDPRPPPRRRGQNRRREAAAALPSPSTRRAAQPPRVSRVQKISHSPTAKT